MCTAMTYKCADHYFGRNLDLEYHYHEQVYIHMLQMKDYVMFTCIHIQGLENK